MTLRVVVADDEPIGRQRLVRLLQAEPDTEVVAACADGEEAVEAIREFCSTYRCRVSMASRS
jgi:two-component system LytT family response regulator